MRTPPEDRVRTRRLTERSEERLFSPRTRSVFTDLDDMRAKIHAYWQPVGGLRLWTAPASGAPV